MHRLILDMMPDDVSCTQDAKDILMDCCVEFIHLLSSEANEICEKENRKTIGPEHVISALESLGFSEYLVEVQQVYDEYKDNAKTRERKGSKLETTGLTEEELLKQQEELFQKARNKLHQASSEPDNK